MAHGPLVFDNYSGFPDENPIRKCSLCQAMEEWLRPEWILRARTLIIIILEHYYMYSSVPDL